MMPKKWASREELEGLINGFFQYCEMNDKPLTYTRLAVFLGTNRQTLKNYMEKPKFKPVLEWAKAMIEADTEERLQAGKGSAAGCIFTLKNNYGWKDQTEIKQDLNVSHEAALGELENAIAAGAKGPAFAEGQPDGLREDLPLH